MSISDLYFAAHFVGLLHSLVGAAMLLDAHKVVLDHGRRIEADVVIKAVRTLPRRPDLTHGRAPHIAQQFRS